MVKTRAFTMQLHPEHFEQYVRRHDEIWTELTTLLSNAGISDYSIYIDDARETLFGTFKYRDEARLDALPHDPTMKRWWEFMAPLMETNPDNSPVQMQLEEIFRHDPPLRGHEDPFDPEVILRVKEDVPEPCGTTSYIASNGRERLIEIFRPDNLDPDLKLPAILLCHGGGWRIGSPEDIARQAYLVSQLGIVVLAPEYAVTEKDNSTPQDSFNDAFLCWDRICRSSQELGFDLDRLGAGGSSAGGHLASCLVNNDPLAAPKPLKRPDLLLLFEAVIDNGPGGYGYDRVADYWETFSPLHNIGSSHPPTLMITGGADELVPVQTALRYRDAVKRTGSVCEVEIFPGTEHGWFQREGFEVTAKSALSFLSRQFL